MACGAPGLLCDWNFELPTLSRLFFMARCASIYVHLTILYFLLFGESPSATRGRPRGREADAGNRAALTLL